MKQNMGFADRSLRLLLAINLGFLYNSDPEMGSWRVVLMIVICALAATAIVGICPLYRYFDFRTDDREE